MLRRIAAILVTIALVAGGIAALAEETAGVQGPKAPLEARVKDLLARMTLEEKIAQLGGDQDRHVHA